MTEEGVFKNITAIRGLHLALAISMLVIGDRYNKEDLCRLDAPYCMLVLGGLTLGFAIGGVLHLLFCSWSCTFLDGSERNGNWFAAIGYIGIYLAYFGGLIWATVRVFSSYNEWTYEDKKSETYCEYTPFVFAMVMVIVNWIYLSLLIARTYVIQIIQKTQIEAKLDVSQNQEGTVELGIKELFGRRIIIH